MALGHDRKEEKASFPVPEVDEGESGSLNGTWKLIKIMRNRKEGEESVGGEESCCKSGTREQIDLMAAVERHPLEYVLVFGGRCRSIS